MLGLCGCVLLGAFVRPHRGPHTRGGAAHSFLFFFHPCPTPPLQHTKAAPGTDRQPQPRSQPRRGRRPFKGLVEGGGRLAAAAAGGDRMMHEGVSFRCCCCCGGRAAWPGWHTLPSARANPIDRCVDRSAVRIVWSIDRGCRRRAFWLWLRSIGRSTAHSIPSTSHPISSYNTRLRPPNHTPHTTYYTRSSQPQRGK